VSRGQALIALCVAAAVVEALLVVLLGPAAAIALAPQVSGLAPIGVFHDLRWLLVFTDSWTTFGFELGALLVVRTVFTAACVRLAWPAGRAAPSWRSLLLRSLSITLVTGVLLFPFASLLFGMAVVSVSWFFLGAFPAVIAICLVTAHGSATSWWRRAPALAAVGWAGASLLVMTVTGGLAVAASSPAAVLWVAAGGAFNGFAWLRLVPAVVTGRRRVRFAPVAPVALAASLALVVGVVTVMVHNGHSRRGRPGGTLGPAVSSRAPGRLVLVMAGFATKWDGKARFDLGPGFEVRRFSYRGLGPDQRPLPYTSGDTQRTLPQLVRLLSAQVDALAGHSGQKVSIVAESEGALAAKAYLASDPGAPVRALVLLSPLIDPARVYFPPPNTPGWGLVGGAGARALLKGLDVTTPLNLTADGPLIRSIEDQGPLVRGLVSCQIPGVRQLALIPLADAVGAPYGPDLAIPSAVVVAFHGTLFAEPAVAKLTAAFLRDGTVPGFRWRSEVEQVIRAAASPWQVPTLPLSLNPSWQQPAPACSQLGSALG